MTAHKFIPRLAIVLALTMLLLAPAAMAQLQLETIKISDGVDQASPIAIVPFAVEGTSAEPATDVAQVIADDLGRTGQFRPISRDNLVEQPSRGEDVRFGTFRLLGADHIVIGRLGAIPSGGYDVQFELHNTTSQQRLLSLSIPVPSGDLRAAAHYIADLVYEEITGVPGFFSTRIAYVIATGVGENRTFELRVADSDGQNPQMIVGSDEPLLSPTWSPDGGQLAYVSFEGGNSSIYVQDVASASRRLVASHRGINGAPAFSPDGERLAVALSKGGNLDIYIMDLNNPDNLRQITSHYAIDTEPAWSKDGSRIYFTSDRGGKPQIYSVPASGGEATRISRQGDYNAHASINPVGNTLATARGKGNVYKISIFDLDTGRSDVITPGPLDESPTFAPNGTMLLYATKEGSRGVLYAVTTDGRFRQSLVLEDGDVREPAWSPIRQ